MEITVARVGQPLDGHEKHCEERHQVINSTLARLSHDVTRLTSDVENIKENLREMREDMREARRDADNRDATLRREMRWMGGGIVGFMTFALAVSTYINSLT